jgi:hypothetical protein
MPERDHLPAAFLLGEDKFESPVNTSAYQSARDANPTNRFQGTLELLISPGISVYYVFSDGGHFEWAGAAVESNNICQFCV